MNSFLRHGLFAAVAVLLVIAGILTAAAPPPRAGATAPAGALPPPLVVGLMRDLPPYESVTPEGEPVGYHVDLVRAVARELNRGLEFRVGSWAENVASLQTGEIDLIPAMIRTEERDREFGLSLPHTTLTYSIFTRRGTAALRTETDLTDRAVLLPRGGIMEKILMERIPSMRVLPCDAEDESLARLARGEGDAAIFLTLQGRLILARQGLDAAIEVAGEPLFTQETRFALRRDDAATLVRINEALKILDTSGERRRIFEKWFGRAPAAAENRVWKERALVIAGILLAIILLVSAWLLSVRRLVRLRTAELDASRDELRHLVLAMETDREENRCTIARELHDDLGQSLTSLKLFLSLMKKKCAGKCPESTETLDRAIEKTNEGIRSVKEVVQRLRPPILDDLGLAAAFEWQCREIEKSTGLDLRLKIMPEDLAARPEVEIALFRILQESLTNVVRHAGATQVTVLLAKRGDAITLEIEDDGIGFDANAEKTSRSYGLLGIRERVRNLGGTLEITPGPEKGTIVRVVIPEQAA
jgi:signal transduction histidine kinase